MVPKYVGKMYMAKSDKRDDLIRAIKLAAESYTKKFGRSPTCVIIPTAGIDDARLVEYVERQEGYTLLNKFGYKQHGSSVWVGGLEDVEHDWVEIASSNIHKVRWDELMGGLLKVIFKDGSVYNYHHVPEEVYQALLDSDSKGRYFAENIKGVYTYDQESPKKPSVKEEDPEEIVVELEPGEIPINALIAAISVIRDEGYNPVGVMATSQLMVNTFINSNLLPGAEILLDESGLESGFIVLVKKEN